MNGNLGDACALDGAAVDEERRTPLCTENFRALNMGPACEDGDDESNADQHDLPRSQENGPLGSKGRP